MQEINAASKSKDSLFAPPAWIENRHLQTILPTLRLSAQAQPKLKRELVVLPDGDITAVDWLLQNSTCPTEHLPLIIILHGLEGSSKSHYIRSLLNSTSKRGWEACVLHFRDCGHPNKLPRRYHAGDTKDFEYFLQTLRARCPERPIYAVGYSLGGNALLKHLGDGTDSAMPNAAAAVCAPLDLHASEVSLSSGFSRIYQAHLINRLKSSVRQKFSLTTPLFDWYRGMKATTFAEFDDAVTAPLHGFKNKDDYYDTASSIRYLSNIKTPTLILQAADDPFTAMPSIRLPDLPSQVQLCVSPHGGHVGFVSGGSLWKPHYYLPQRILNYFHSLNR